MLGLGKVGVACASLFKKLGVKVIGFSHRSADVVDSFTLDVNHIFEQSDYVLNCLPDTASARELLRSPPLLRPGAILISVGDSVAGPEETEEGRWPPPGSVQDAPRLELAQWERCFVTPRIAGLYTDRDVLSHLATLWEHYTNNQPLDCVNWEKGY